MKRISTLFFVSMLCLAMNAAAQITETFEGALPSCFTLTNASITNNGINGGKSVLLPNNTINSTTGPIVIKTPYINFTATSAKVSFTYSLSGTVATARSGAFRLGTVNNSGVVTYTNNITYSYNYNAGATSSSFTLTSNSSIVTASFPITAGIQGLVIEYTADANAPKVLMDDLNINGTYHYASFCNTAPTANNDTYNAVMPNAISGNVITNVNGLDTDNENETLTASLVKAPAKGALILNADGSFSYKPAGNAGGTITFTYMITDNGYEAKTATATVTLNYTIETPMPFEITPLPVRLTSFAGNMENNKVQLTWTADDNETGSYFEVEKSSGDNKFKTIALITNTGKVGTEVYTYYDAAEVNGYNNYRLKIVNKDNTISYSKIIAFKAKGTEATSSLSLLQNPITSSVPFNYAAATTGVYTATLYTTSGVKVVAKQVVFQKGMNATLLSLNNNLPNGTYILEVAGSNVRSTVKVSRQ